MAIEDVIEDKCNMHGKKQKWGYSKTAKAWVCVGCVCDGFYIDTIKKEVLASVKRFNKLTGRP